ncbi:MAG TPA: DUF2007 domain-containing protein, partial [Bacteroidia bacterium]|nr:DUF2007 domain-containing protein [Bacteroidia bacterium]
MNDWELVYTSTLPHRVEIVLEVLKDQDIEAVKLDKRDSSYTMLGEMEVYTKKEDAILAKIIIEQ